jgi:hypothetical protein
MRIAVYTIARDEEEQLDRWVASIRDADVIVLADTGSADETVGRARELGVDVHQIEVEPFRYDTARNRALDLVPDDVQVCLALDVDEVLMPGWRDQLESAWRPGTTTALCWFEWRWSETFLPLRFTTQRIHARSGYRWECPVHEQLVAETAEVPVRTQIEIHHLRDASRPTAGNLELLRLAVEERPGDGRMAHLLANDLRMSGLPAEAAHHFRRALDLPLAANERMHSMLMLSHLEPERREEWLLQACNAFPDRREPWCGLAQLNHERGRWRECRATALTALRITTPADDYLMDPYAWGTWPEQLAADAARELGRPARPCHVIVSMTTIPSRIGLIEPVIESLLAQTYRDFELRLYIPTMCSRTGGRYELPEPLVTRTRDDPRFTIRLLDRDYGPATKLLGPLEDGLSGQDACVITVDDDVLLEEHAIEELVEASQLYPDDALGFMGVSAEDYIHAEQLAAGGLPHATPSILGGYRSVLYPASVLDGSLIEDFEALSACSSTAIDDDRLFAWNLARRGVTRRVIATRHPGPDFGLNCALLEFPDPLTNGADGGDAVMVSRRRLMDYYSSKGWSFPP